MTHEFRQLFGLLQSLRRVSIYRACRSYIESYSYVETILAKLIYNYSDLRANNGHLTLLVNVFERGKMSITADNGNEDSVLLPNGYQL